MSLDNEDDPACVLSETHILNSNKSEIPASISLSGAQEF